MKPFEEQFTAWVDGKLTGTELAEFEKQLADHPEATADRDEARALGKLLREYPTTPRLTNPDFFNHQLIQRIATETPQPRPVEKKRSFFWSIPGLAWAGAFCLVITAALFKMTIPGGAAVAEEQVQLFCPGRRDLVQVAQRDRQHGLQSGERCHGGVARRARLHPGHLRAEVS